MDADVALVGLIAEGLPNHALAALRRAVTRAGLSAEVVPFGGWPDLADACAQVERARPRVCGISVPSGEGAPAALALAWTLRRRGFAGRLICGGHFATLNARELLESAAGFDAVVRFAGEEALVGLARGADPAGLPGLVFRDGKGAFQIGAPARIAAPDGGGDDEPLPLHLGFPAADLIFSRGCEARCAYCCIPAASALAEEEAARAGAAPARYAREAGETVADRIAALAGRGARVLQFMDDNLLPLDPAEAAAWATALRAELDRRGVGRIAFSLQLRADAVDAASADALAALGLVRAYVGIDGYSAPQLRALGRAADPDAGTRAIRLLRARGIYAVCNALLVGPTIPFDSLRAEIDGLARLDGAPVHLLPIEARPGTRYHEIAARRGLVEGACFWRHYRFADPRTERLASIVTGLPTRLAEHSVPIALYDLAFDLGVAAALAPCPELAAAHATWERVTAAWNADQIRLLRAAAAAAERDADADALLEHERPRVRAHDEALLAACRAAQHAVEEALSRRGRTARSPGRGRQLSAVAFAMGLAACARDRPQGSFDAATAGDLAGATDAAVPFDAAGLDLSASSCDAESPNPPCFSGCINGDQLLVTFDGQGHAVGFMLGDGGALTPMMDQCLRDLFANYCYPSLAGQTAPVTSHCWIA